MAVPDGRDSEMEDLELYSGSWCGHPATAPTADLAAATMAASSMPAPAPPSAISTSVTAQSRHQVNDGRNSLLTHRDSSTHSTVTSVTGNTFYTGTTQGNTWPEQDGGALGRGYTQCKSARFESRASAGVEVSAGADLGKECKVQPDKIGNLNLASDKLLYKTFRGCRVTSKGESVNQILSTTFDPQTLQCTVCENNYSILPTDGTDLAILVSDQNFVSALSGNTSCVPIIRLEDPTLKEQFEICLEIFDRCPLPSVHCSWSTQSATYVRWDLQFTVWNG